MLWKSIKVARTLKKSSLNPIIVAKTSLQPAICKLYVLYLFFLILVNEIINFACLSLHSFQVSKFNSIQFSFAMSGMEAAKMTIRSSKFNATVKNSKRKKQHNISTYIFTAF